MSFEIQGRDPESVQRQMLGTHVFQKKALVRARQIHTPFAVHTLEGTMRANAGDYLVSDFEMTHAWPVRRDVFESTYEKV